MSMQFNKQLSKVELTEQEATLLHKVKAYEIGDFCPVSWDELKEVILLSWKIGVPVILQVPLARGVSTVLKQEIPRWGRGILSLDMQQFNAMDAYWWDGTFRDDDYLNKKVHPNEEVLMVEEMQRTSRQFMQTAYNISRFCKINVGVIYLVREEDKLTLDPVFMSDAFTVYYAASDLYIATGI